MDLLGSVFNFGSGLIQNKLNKEYALDNQLQTMKQSDIYQRNFLKDQYGIQRSGLEEAGYNPLLALGSAGSSEALQLGSAGSGASGSAVPGEGLISTAKQLEMFRDVVKGKKLENQKIIQDIKNSKDVTRAQVTQLLQSAKQLSQSTKNMKQDNNLRKFSENAANELNAHLKNVEDGSLGLKAAGVVSNFLSVLGGFR